MRSPSGTARRWRADLLNGRIVIAAAMLVCFAIGAGIVFAELARPAGLYGVTQYDDAVYFASSLRLTQGALDYRDFVLVQPPGISVLLLPISGLAHLIGVRHGMGLARILTGVVAGVNASLVCLVASRYGKVAALVAGMLMAIFPPAYAADHTLMLEPYLVLFCLIGTLLAYPPSGARAETRRPFLAGLSYGVAGSVKTWAVFPLAPLALVGLIRNRRAGLRVVVGAAVGFIVICGVFFIAAPHAFVTDVVTSQLSRQTARPTPIISRLWAITGLSYSSSTLLLQHSRSLIIAVTCLIGALLAFGSALPCLLRRGDDLEIVTLGSIATTVAAMFVPQQFFDHYAYFSAAFLALGLGIVAGRASHLLVGFAKRRLAGQRLLNAGALSATVFVVIVAICAALVISPETSYDKILMNHFSDPGSSFAASIPNGACTVSDAETEVVSAGRALSSTPGCPTIIDQTGTWISYEPQTPPSQRTEEPKSPALVALWSSIFDHADYVIFSGPKAWRIPWTTALRAQFDRQFERVPGAQLLVYERRPN